MKKYFLLMLGALLLSGISYADDCTVQPRYLQITVKNNVGGTLLYRNPSVYLAYFYNPLPDLQINPAGSGGDSTTFVVDWCRTPKVGAKSSGVGPLNVTYNGDGPLGPVSCNFAYTSNYQGTTPCYAYPPTQLKDSLCKIESVALDGNTCVMKFSVNISQQR